MTPMRSLLASGLVTFGIIGVIAGCEDESTGTSPTNDGGGLEVSLPDATPINPPTDGGTNQDAPTTGNPRTGYFVRFAHMAESAQADDLDFCVSPKGAENFKAIYTPLGRRLKYGEVGRFVPIDPGAYDYRVTPTGDCEDFDESNDFSIAPTQPYARITHSSIRAFGTVSVTTFDLPMAHDATKDRLTIHDGTASTDSGTTSFAMTWTAGSTTVPVTFGSRAGTAQLPPGENGTVSFTFNGVPKQQPLRSVADGHVLLFVYGSGETKVCDNDAPIPNSGVVSPCGDR